MGDETQPESQVANVEGSTRLSSMSKMPPGQLKSVAWSAAKGTVVELSHSVRQTKDASSALLTWLRLDAERRLGMEINVDDPALLHLFECLLQVESLLQQALAQSKALIEGVAHLADPTPMAAVLPTNASPLSSSSLAFMWKNLTSTKGPSPANAQQGQRTMLAMKLAELAQRQLSAASQHESPSAGLQASVSACLDSMEMVRAAEWNTTQWSPNAGEGGSARYRLQRRLKEEVIEPVEKQLAEHDRLRKLLREQKTWKQAVKSSRREVVAVTKQEATQVPSPAGSTDIARSSIVGAKQQMTGQYEVAQLKATELDQEILLKLMEAKERAFETVTRPWSVLAEIRKEFFGELAKQWGPAATTLGAPDEDSRRDRARALAAARLQAKAAIAENSKGVVGARTDWSPQQQIASEPSEEREEDDEEDDELPRVEDAPVFNSGSDDEEFGKELVEEAQAAILSREEAEIEASPINQAETAGETFDETTAAETNDQAEAVPDAALAAGEPIDQTSAESAAKASDQSDGVVEAIPIDEPLTADVTMDQTSATQTCDQTDGVVEATPIDQAPAADVTMDQRAVTASEQADGMLEDQGRQVDTDFASFDFADPAPVTAKIEEQSDGNGQTSHQVDVAHGGNPFDIVGMTPEAACAAALTTADQTDVTVESAAHREVAPLETVGAVDQTVADEALVDIGSHNILDAFTESGSRDETGAVPVNLVQGPELVTNLLGETQNEVPFEFVEDERGSTGELPTSMDESGAVAEAEPTSSPLPDHRLEEAFDGVEAAVDVSAQPSAEPSV